jgi:hypothetical protein
MKNITQYLTESKTISKTNYQEFIKNDGMDQELREWYKKEYKTDSLGNELPTMTFAEVLAQFFNDLDKFEEETCADDSIVRERIFKKLTELCKVKYDNFYDYWLHN